MSNKIDFAQRETAREKVMKSLSQISSTINTLLPAFMSLEQFQAYFSRALITNPEILDCTPNSIVKAVLRAAEGGYKIDGKESALVAHETTYNKGRANETKVKLCEFFPMAYGIQRQIMRSGAVTQLNVDVVYAKDHIEIHLGSDPRVVHSPFLMGPRGDIIGAYSSALLKDGGVSIEWLGKEDLASIRAAAQTQKVWERWPGEMSKKSALHRHHKRLPVQDDIYRDAQITPDAGRHYDAIVDQLAQQQPQARVDAKPKPTRQALQHNPDNGVPLDLQDRGEPEPVEQQRAKPASAEPAAKQAEPAHDPQIPANEDEWTEWESYVSSAIARAKSADELTKFMQGEEARLNNPACGKDRAASIRAQMTDRITDLSIGE